MKKNLSRLLAALLAIAMLLTLAACGGKDSEGSSSEAGSQVVSSTPKSSVSTAEGDRSTADNDSSDTAADGNSDTALANGEKYADIQAFLDDPTVKSQIDSMVEAMASSGGMNITVTAEGSKLVYTFTFDEFPEGTDMDSIAAQLEEGMSDVSATFESIADQLKSVVDEDNPTVVVSYNAANGDVIYSKEFSAQ